MAVSHMNIMMHRIFPHVTGSLAKYDPLELKFGVLKRLAWGTISRENGMLGSVTPRSPL